MEAEKQLSILNKEEFSLLTKAIEKLQSEMTKNTTNSYIQVVGGFLLQHLSENPQDADKILVIDKTIGKSLDEMQKAAGKKKVGNTAMFTPQEGFEIVMKYFGIKDSDLTTARAAAPIASSDRVTQPSAAESKPSIDFDIKLEDLL